eukprot:TRINITY_DN13498_c0_g1_i2.p1 TRINITY_DN13498_c0_g1~~TRINITY_DN13498_c0_g1_i2.p1  ORF type:complete len:2071 (+),score=687.48 TRINITY_DN13498_c0_g1_i2:533-6214(+)
MSSMRVPFMIELFAPSKAPFSTAGALKLLSRKLGVDVRNNNTFTVRDDKLFVEVTKDIKEKAASIEKPFFTVDNDDDDSSDTGSVASGSPDKVFVRFIAHKPVGVTITLHEEGDGHMTIITDGTLIHTNHEKRGDAKFTTTAMGLLLMYDTKRCSTNEDMLASLQNNIKPSKPCDKFKKSEVHDDPCCPKGEYCRFKHALDDLEKGDMQKCCSMSARLFDKNRPSTPGELRTIADSKIPELIRGAHSALSEHRKATRALQTALQKARMLNDAEEVAALEGKLDNCEKQRKDFVARMEDVSMKKTWNIPLSLHDLRVFARELARIEARLPILAERERLMQLVRDNMCVVIILDAAPGSGKSTQMFQYLAEELGPRQVVCTQPNYFAAKALRQRVEAEMGYNQENDVMKNAFKTDRDLLQELSRSKMRTYTAFIVDELHERSVATDCLLPLLKEELENRVRMNKKMCLVLSSATMDVEAFCDYFASPKYNVEVVRVTGKTHPVDIRYPEVPEPENYIEVYPMLVEQKVRGVLRDIPNPVDFPHFVHRDVLVFLPTAEDCTDLAKKMVRNPPEVPAVFLTLTETHKGDVFKRESRKVKVIFATRIAETSLTIDGVVAVIDTGLALETKYEAKQFTTRSSVQRISQSSATQRAGRAGRTCPGVCYRLYSHDSFTDAQKYVTPEILRADPTDSLFYVNASLNKPLRKIDFVSRPAADVLNATINVFQRLGLVNGTTKLLDEGSAVLRLLTEKNNHNLSVREACFLLLCSRKGCRDLAIKALTARQAGMNAVQHGYRPRTRDPRYHDLGDMGLVMQAHDDKKLNTAAKEVRCSGLPSGGTLTAEQQVEVLKKNMMTVFPEVLGYVHAGNVHNYPRGVVSPLPKGSTLRDRDTVLCLEVVGSQACMLVPVDDALVPDDLMKSLKKELETATVKLEYGIDNYLVFGALQKMGAGAVGWVDHLGTYSTISISEPNRTVTFHVVPQKKEKLKEEWEEIFRFAERSVACEKIECPVHERSGLRMIAGKGYETEKVMWGGEETLSVAFSLMKGLDDGENIYKSLMTMRSNDSIREALVSLVGQPRYDKLRDKASSFKASLMVMQYTCLLYLEEEGEFDGLPKGELQKLKEDPTKRGMCLLVMSAAQTMMTCGRPQAVNKSYSICVGGKHQESTTDDGDSSIVVEGFSRAVCGKEDPSHAKVFHIPPHVMGRAAFGVFNRQTKCVYFPAGTSFDVDKDGKTVLNIKMPRVQNEQGKTKDRAYETYKGLMRMRSVTNVAMNIDSSTGEVYGKVHFATVEDASEFTKRDWWYDGVKMQTRKAPGCEPPLCTLKVHYYPTKPVRTRVHFNKNSEVSVKEALRDKLIKDKDDNWFLTSAASVPCHESILERKLFRGTNTRLQHEFDPIGEDYCAYRAAFILSGVVAVHVGNVNDNIVRGIEGSWRVFELGVEDPKAAERAMAAINDNNIGWSHNEYIGYMTATVSNRVTIPVPIPYNKLRRVKAYVEGRLQHLAKDYDGLKSELICEPFGNTIKIGGSASSAQMTAMSRNVSVMLAGEGMHSLTPHQKKRLHCKQTRALMANLEKEHKEHLVYYDSDSYRVLGSEEGATAIAAHIYKAITDEECVVEEKLTTGKDEASILDVLRKSGCDSEGVIKMGKGKAMVTLRGRCSNVDDARSALADTTARGSDVCVACMDDFEGEAKVSVYCGQNHHLHSDCAEDWVRTFSDREMSPIPIKCPSCQEVLTVKHISSILLQVQVEHTKLKQASVEGYVARHAEAIKACTTVDCRGFVRKDAGGGFVRCVECGEEVCMGCDDERHKAPEYRRLTCAMLRDRLRKDNEERQAEAALAGFKKCPRCKTPTEKSTGCNAMKCRCGCGWCWLCIKDCGADAHPHFGEKHTKCYSKLFHGVY